MIAFLLGNPSITIRSMCAFFTAFGIMFYGMPFFITYMKKIGYQPIREDGPETHKEKQKTPTMGGVMMIATCVLCALFWCVLHNPYVGILTMVLIGFGMLGAWDDYLKITQQHSRGISAKTKMMTQIGLAWVTVYALQKIGPDSTLHIPFIGMVVHLGVMHSLLSIFMVVGTSNAVNLTDGLDGLATGLTLIATCTLMFIGVYHQDPSLSPHVPEVFVLCAALIGTCLGFLWYNAAPASIMMGDTGSLALGGFLATLSIILKKQMLFGIIGGVFVAEAISVIIQVYVFHTTKKRFFLMAPIHHHFEKKGWTETMVVSRFWIVGCILSALSLCGI